MYEVIIILDICIEFGANGSLALFHCKKKNLCPQQWPKSAMHFRAFDRNAEISLDNGWPPRWGFTDAATGQHTLRRNRQRVFLRCSLPLKCDLWNWRISNALSYVSWPKFLWLLFNQNPSCLASTKKIIFLSHYPHESHQVSAEV